jgi:hypothetical protein
MQSDCGCQLLIPQRFGCLGIFRGIPSFPVRLKTRCSAIQLTLFLRLRSANRTNNIERLICDCHFSLVPQLISQ